MDAPSKTRLYRLAMVVTATLLGAASCPPSPSPPPAVGQADATLPGFASIAVRFEDPSTGRVLREINLDGPDSLEYRGLGPDVRLRLVVVAGDPESGIGNATVTSNVRWRCRRSSGPLSATFDNAPIAFDAFQQPATPLAVFGFNITADPIAQTGCIRGPGIGPEQVEGEVRVTLTNGAAPSGVDTSRSLLFAYQDALGPATGTQVSAGRSADTPYIEECRRLGVPIPPDWSRNATAWMAHGNVGDNNNNLLQPGMDAFIWTYTHPRVRGACIALPRASGSARGGLAGIICQSATTGNACFWDSRNLNPNNPAADSPAIDWQNQAMRIRQLKDAITLTAGDIGFPGGSGRCTDCHQGENVFLLAPDDPKWGNVLRIGDLGANFTTKVEASTDMTGPRPRYMPVSGLGGAVRSGWVNSFGGPTTCEGVCHERSLGGASGLFLTPAMPPRCAGVPNPDPALCYR